jgi:uncharacterized repeat protein (TIGR02543 family)
VDGYSFSGWNTKVDGTGVSYAVGSVLTVDEEDVVLYAQWTEQKYVVTVIDSFASGSSGAGNYVGGSVVTIHAGNRVDYIFDGWIVNSGNNVVFVDAMAVTTTFVMPAEDVSVTANWMYVGVVEPSGVYVWYDGNGATDGYVPVDNNLYEYGDVVMVAANSGNLVRSGYDFLGWAYGRSASVVFAVDGASVTPSIFVIGDSDVMLYAVWSKVGDYCVVYNANWPDNTVGTGAVPIDDNIYSSGETVLVQANPNNLAYDGYAFLGWALNSTVTTPTFAVSGNVVTPTSFTIDSSDVTLYAVWSKSVIPPVVDKGYSITYRYSGSVPSGVPALPLTEYNIAVGTIKQIASVPTLTGYLFVGWSTKDVVVSGNSFTMPNNDVLFTGQWLARNYTVQYDLNGGNPDIASRVNISWGTSNLLPASIPEKANYTFGGWHYNNINVANTHKYSDLAANEDILSITLQAKWVLTDNEITEKTGEWALVNLLISILGIILAIIAIIRALHWNNQEDQDKKTQKMSSLAKISFIITILLGIIGIAVFLITQDLTTTMMIIRDKWTILHAAILIIETLTLLVVLKKTTTNNSNNQQKAASQTQ